MVQTLLAMAGGIAFIIAIAVIATRGSQRAWRRHNEAAAASDRAMAALASRLGFSFLAGENDEHPTMGTRRGFAAVTGRIRGLGLVLNVRAVTLSASQAQVSYRAMVEVQFRSLPWAPATVTLHRGPRPDQLKARPPTDLFPRCFDGPGLESTPTSAMPILLDLAAEADCVRDGQVRLGLELSSTRLRLLPRLAPTMTSLSSTYHTLVDDAELERWLARVVSVAERLGAAPLGGQS